MLCLGAFTLGRILEQNAFSEEQYLKSDIATTKVTADY